ncbi:MAG: hypothetical protein HOJ15_04700 [Candidatus Jacksonbacteria bacterium]|nr:hypothetical protein [Candidatus Jacksonbacteria bacterium]
MKKLYSEKFLIVLIMIIAVSSFSFVSAATDQVNVTLTVTNPGTPPEEDPDPEPDPEPEAPPASVVNPFLGLIPGEIPITDPDIVETQTFTVFLGKTSPGSKVVLLKDGTLIQRVTTDGLGSYKIIVPNLSPGAYVWGIRASDTLGFETRLVTFSRELGRDVTTVLSDIILPPSIYRTKINTGFQFIGTAVPNSQVVLSFIEPETGQEYLEVLGSSGTDGGWSIMVQENQILIDSELQVRAAVVIGEERSVWSDGKAIEKKFVAPGDKESSIPDGEVLIPEAAFLDANNDNAVNEIDFAIIKYWLQQPVESIPKEELEKVDVNNDGEVNMQDMSILAYYWTG